jgi:hypothetical protein
VTFEIYKKYKVTTHKKGENMLNDCKYNKIKLLHELSSIVWFLEKCAIPDAKKTTDDAQCVENFKSLQNTLETHIKKLETSLEQ